MKVQWLVFVALMIAVLVFSIIQSSHAGDVAPRSMIPYVPTPRPTEGCDICEPNQTWGQACGPLATGTDYQFPIRCLNPAQQRDIDIFYIDLKTPGTVFIDLTSIPAGTDYSVYLYDEDRFLLPCWVDLLGNADEHLICHATRSGRYYIWVYPWSGCNDSDPYNLAVTYPTPPPVPMPTPASQPPCNVHIDDFEGAKASNDLGKPFGWALNPPGCGSLDVKPTGGGDALELNYSLPPQCTARYTTTLGMSAYPYQSLTVRVGGDRDQDIFSATVGVNDQTGNSAQVRVGDFLDQVVTDTYHSWQAVAAPLSSFAMTVNTAKLDTFFVEFTGVTGTTYLDNIRLEQPRVPLVVDNFNDSSDPNALGGAMGTFSGGGGKIQTTYTTSGTHGGSKASYAISYSVPISGWVSWKTDLLGLDASGYSFLSFYVKGAQGDERVNVYLQDRNTQRHWVDLESYTRIVTDWVQVRIPLRDFGVDLKQLSEIQLAFEWEPMTGTIMIDDLVFDAGTLLVDNFCDDGNPMLKDTRNRNSLGWDTGTFDSRGVLCPGIITSTSSGGALRLDYDVTAGPKCYAGYYALSRLDLAPYRTLMASVRGERCGEFGVVSAATMSVKPVKVKLSDYLPDGITDQWQPVSIPVAAFPEVTDWTRGDSYSVAFEAERGASKGTLYWDDAAYTTACAPVWVDNFNDQDSANALRGGYSVVYSGTLATLGMSMPITQAHGDVGSSLWLTYSVPYGLFADWETDLLGLNVSNYKWLVFDVRGSGGADPHIYLQDNSVSHYRKYTHLSYYVTLSEEWQRAVIPLQAFAGVDLSQLEHLQIVVEYEDAAVQGVLALDNIRFEASADCDPAAPRSIYLPLVAKEYQAAFDKPVLDYVWDFESGTAGWMRQTYTNTQAVAAVEASSFRAISGSYSLALLTDLVGDDAHKSQGEAYVPLSNLNLACKPITCWVYVPTCGAGDAWSPNQIQLFVKDKQGKSEYGTPMNILRNQWFQVSLRPSVVTPDGGFKQAGFNPAEISALGVKFAAGSQQATYQGKIYLDACGWQKIDPSSATSMCGP